MKNEPPEQSRIPVALWSDDCLNCLCNLPHSMEEHTQAVMHASEERQRDIQEMEAWADAGTEREEEELTPDELRHLIASLFNLQTIIDLQLADEDTPILDEYCWDNEHNGGWTCRQCYEQQQKGETH